MNATRPALRAVEDASIKFIVKMQEDVGLGGVTKVQDNLTVPFHNATGGYDHVADALFGRLNVNGFFLEYDDARCGGFEPLRFVPKGKMVVLGLVASKRAAI